MTAMGTNSNNQKAYYVYGIVDRSLVQICGIEGVEESQVFLIEADALSAVVSQVAGKRIRAERRNLEAHQAVLAFLMAQGTVLPMGFGTVVDTTGSVKRVLWRNQEALLEQFERLAGTVEMGLSMRWDVPNIFDYFVGRHLELKLARDRIFAPGRAPAYADKVEIGKLFEQLLLQARNDYSRKVEDVMSRHCIEIKRNPCRAEAEVMNLACLVSKERLERFAAAIQGCAREFDQNYLIAYGGPWPPQSFVDVKLDAGV